VADAFGVRVTGLLAYLMWAVIHVAYLVGWGNRLGTLYTWARALWFSHNRAHRIITFGQAGTPAALARAVRATPIEPAAPASAESPRRRQPRPAGRADL
jgi:NADH dehydrogenase